MRQLDRRRVALVESRYHGVEEGAVEDVPGDRPDLVETRGEGHDAVTRDGAVGGPQADVAAERRRLLDRASGVRAERPGREAGADGRGGPAAGTAGNARGIPGVA